jgi:hypothetical protein
VKVFLPYRTTKPIIAEYTEHCPPDTTAGIFWLKNRRPDQWRDAWQIDAAVGHYVVRDHTLTEAE